MRIISGTYKNHPIKSSNSILTHPMGDREKLALFNILTPYLDGAVVLDVFAGTGALGLECLSRGATSATFVEKSHKIAEILRENINSVLKSSEKSRNTAIPNKSNNSVKIIIDDIKNTHFDPIFTLIVADPPYDLFSEALISPLEKFLVDTGVLALSMPKSSPTPVMTNLKILTERTYARAKIVLYQKNA